MNGAGQILHVDWTARGIMKTLRTFALIFCVAASAAASYADGLPPDGPVGVQKGSKSQQITSTQYSFSFQSCAGATGDVAADCAAAGPGTQEIFAGINDSGVAWNQLTVTLNLNQNPSNPDLSIGCDVSTVFAAVGGACGTVLSSTQTSVTVIFSQGATGTGIGCYNSDTTIAPNQAYYNQLCSNNATSVLQNNILKGRVDPYTGVNDYLNGATTCPGQSLGEVCGSNDFIIAIGDATTQWNSLPTGGTLIANPEPTTFLLGGGAALGMILLGLLRRRAFAL